MNVSEYRTSTEPSRSKPPIAARAAAPLAALAMVATLLGAGGCACVGRAEASIRGERKHGIDTRSVIAAGVDIGASRIYARAGLATSFGHGAPVVDVRSGLVAGVDQDAPRPDSQTGPVTSTTGSDRAAHGALGIDEDQDGLDDAAETSIAKDYFPYYSLDLHEDCARHGVLFRVTPHPEDARKLALWYVVLFERDCGRHGIGAHVGDDEVFGEIVDPAVPAPKGILAIRAISHQNTTCERVTSCGSLGGCRACATAVKDGKPYPIVFSSASKHGNYASESACNFWPCDLAGCALTSSPDTPDFVNAGEPGHPLVRNLTTEGFVTPANGWTEPSLTNFDPWANTKFGRAGDVTDDLLDPSFLISPSGCD